MTQATFADIERQLADLGFKQVILIAGNDGRLSFLRHNLTDAMDACNLADAAAEAVADTLIGTDAAKYVITEPEERPLQ